MYIPRLSYEHSYQYLLVLATTATPYCSVCFAPHTIPHTTDVLNYCCNCVIGVRNACHCMYEYVPGIGHKSTNITTKPPSSASTEYIYDAKQCSSSTSSRGIMVDVVIMLRASRAYPSVALKTPPPSIPQQPGLLRVANAVLVIRYAPKRIPTLFPAEVLPVCCRTTHNPPPPTNIPDIALGTTHCCSCCLLHHTEIYARYAPLSPNPTQCCEHHYHNQQPTQLLFDLIATQEKGSLDTYVVQRGDTLAGVALRLGVKVSDLKRANRMYGSKTLIMGQASNQSVDGPSPPCYH